MYFKVVYEIVMILLMLTYGIIIVAPKDAQPQISNEQLEFFDWTVMVILAVDFAVRIWKTDNRKTFLKKNGWELIALIPLDPSFRLIRLLRFIRLIAFIRTSPLVWHLIRQPALLRILAFTAVVMTWSSFGIYMLERGENDNIRSFGDAVWWSIVTTTTVGYGDISPVSLGGRIIAVFLMITGIGMIGTITANLATHWIEYSSKNAHEPDAVEEVKQQLKDWVDRLETLDDREYELMRQTMDLVRQTGKPDEEKKAPAEESR